MYKALAGKRVVLGVTGGIAAYKAADLTSKLVQLGADVHVVMTEAAQRFIQPFTFEALTRNAVHTSVFDGWQGETAGHVTLAAEADVVMVAPATANTIAGMAHGTASDMLGAVLLATQAPILVAPAMEHHMWHHPATQANLATLMERGVGVVPPERGHLASGASGDGRLADVAKLVHSIRAAVGRGGALAGKRIVITAGATHEPIDPVRFIGNGSSGRMGIALAQIAVDAGADVTLVVGPSVSEVPAGIHTLRVTTALELEEATRMAAADANALIMAAAVADYRPETAATSKIKKQDGIDEMSIPLTRNPDIIAGISQAGLVKVGFAAETDDLLDNAASKLERKGLDMIVANDAVATIGASSSQATLLVRGGEQEQLPRLSKEELAVVIINRVGDLIREGDNS